MMLLMVSEQIGQAVSGMIDKVGIVSMLTILGINVADANGAIEIASSATSEWGAFDWLGLIAGVGTIAFTVKQLVEIRLAYLKIKLAKKNISDEV